TGPSEDEGAAMTEVIATVEHAAQWADRGRRSTARWNPVYRALMDRAGPPPPHAPEIEGSGAAGADLVLRQLSTPALLVVAVTEGEAARWPPVGLEPTGAALEGVEDGHPPRLAELGVAEVAARVSALLEDSGIDLAPARLEITGDEH